MILLQVMETGAKVHHLAVLQTLRKAVRESRRGQSTWISHEKQFGVKRLRQSVVCFLHRRIHISGFSLDRQLIGESPGGPTRFGSREGGSVDRHLFVRQLSKGGQGKHSVHKCIVFKDHLFADTWRPELLEGLNLICVKVLPAAHRPDEFHESKPPDEVGPARGQVKCQCGSPVLRDHECGGYSRLFEKCIEVPDMIGEPVFDVGFSSLAEPYEIRSDAMRDRRYLRRIFRHM